METITAIFSGLPLFLAYFALSLVFIVIFKFLYALVTPYDEWKLVKEQSNTAAAVAFGGAVVGFSVALASAASNSVSFVDFIAWGIIALLAQVLAFAIMRFGFMPRIVERIEKNEVSAGIMLAAMSIAVGLLNGACMSY